MQCIITCIADSAQFSFRKPSVRDWRGRDNGMELRSCRWKQYHGRAHAVRCRHFIVGRNVPFVHIKRNVTRFLESANLSKTFAQNILYDT